ncbi:MAG: hypothetical protein ACK4L7_03300 [Flavobacteriales bacterium]
MPSAFLPDENGSVARPALLSALGALTFINTGLFTLVYGIGLLAMLGVQRMPQEEFMELARESASVYMDGAAAEQMEAILPIIHASGAALMAIYLARTVLRLIGAIGIWRGRRSGFHLYAAAQIMGIFAPHIILPWSSLGVFGPLLAVGMTAAYGSQLKRLGP